MSMSFYTPKRLFVIFNPVAGTCNPDSVRQTIQRYFTHDGHTYHMYETTGQESIAHIAHEAAQQGFDIVVAAGGDGTVSAVANGLIHTQTPVGILPVGTANVLAQELHIPLRLEEACRMLIEPHPIASIDAIRIGDVYAVLHVGIGFDAILIRDTKREEKRRFGKLAYMLNGLKQITGFQPRRFSIAVDGQQHRFHAAQVLLANGGTMGFSMLRWGPDISPDDGIIDVCILNSRTILDYMSVLWHIVLHQQKQDRRIRYLKAQQSIVVFSDTPLPVHSDGDIIGETPIRAHIVSEAVRVAVPPVAVSSAIDDSPAILSSA